MHEGGIAYLFSQHRFSCVDYPTLEYCPECVYGGALGPIGMIQFSPFHRPRLFDAPHQAIKIRVSTDAKLRVDFDARPKFQQASLFASPEASSSRQAPSRDGAVNDLPIAEMHADERDRLES